MSNIAIWSIYGTLSVATTPCQSGSVSNDNEGPLCIPQSSKTGASPSDYLMSYPEHSLVEWGLIRLQKCSRFILQSQPTELSSLDRNAWNPLTVCKQIIIIIIIIIIIKIGIITWNHMIMYKMLEFDRNAWNHTNCELCLLKMNTRTLLVRANKWLET